MTCWIHTSWCMLISDKTHLYSLSSTRTWTCMSPLFLFFLIALTILAGMTMSSSAYYPCGTLQVCLLMIPTHLPYSLSGIIRSVSFLFSAHKTILLWLSTDYLRNFRRIARMFIYAECFIFGWRKNSPYEDVLNLGIKFFNKYPCKKVFVILFIIFYDDFFNNHLTLYYIWNLYYIYNLSQFI